MTAFKDRIDVFAVPPKFIFNVTLDNIYRIFFEVVGEEAESVSVVMTEFTGFFLNSIIITSGGVLFAVLIGALAAYGVSRCEFKNKDFLMFVILSTRMLPPVAVVIPIYLMFRVLRMMNTYHGIILLYAAFNLPFVVWMMKSFFDEIPVEIEQAALVDGSSRLRVFRKIALPQVWAGVAATVVISLIYTWNEFLFAMMLTGSSTRTVPVAIGKALRGEVGVDWGLLAGIETLYIFPVIIVTFLLQKYLLRGITFGTIKR